MGFQVGQKVVCINDQMNSGRPRHPECHYPKEGSIYVVRNTDIVSRPLVWLCEIRNPEWMTAYGMMEPGFDATHFRAVIERKTDISIFTEMLTPQKQRERA